MRIVLFTVDELEFVPELNKRLLETYGSSIVAAYVSKSLFSMRSNLKKMSFFFRNLYPFCIRFSDLLRFSRWKFRLMRRGVDGHRNVPEFLISKGINASYIETINSKQFRDELRELNADIFLFSPFDKIAGPKFLEIPNLGAFNVHLGKLPEYRGGLSAFWVLRFGDREAGSTLHRVVPEIDAGEIIVESRIPVKTSSMHELMSDTVQASSNMIIEGIKKIEGGGETIENSSEDGGYYFYPKLKDFREFYKRGNRLM